MHSSLHPETLKNARVKSILKGCILIGIKVFYNISGEISTRDQGHKKKCQNS